MCLGFVGVRNVHRCLVLTRSPSCAPVCVLFADLHDRFKQAWGRVDGAHWQRATSNQS
jgi:hypothetical protein